MRCSILQKILVLTTQYFYNGPECGASAPDHLHFQASPRLAIPVERDAVNVQRRKRFYYKNHVAGFTLMNYGRAVMIIESTDKNQLLTLSMHCLLSGRSFFAYKEPMVNILCSYQENIGGSSSFRGKSIDRMYILRKVIIAF